MNEAKWELVEKVVAKLEKAISPTARVEHNIYLPDLNGDTDPRQIDVAIWTGVEPRETLSIVEVQDRDSKVDINTFEGWLGKMHDVGAQHLICVSTKGFPKSIINKAIRQGPSVRLITLNEIVPEVPSLDFIDGTMTLCTINPIRCSNSVIDYFVTPDTPIITRHRIQKKERIDFISSKNVFLYNGIPSSLNDIINIFALQLAPSLKEKNNILNIDSSSLFGILEYNGDYKVRCRIKFTAVFDCEKADLPLKFTEYKRIDINCSEAWLIEASGVFKDKPGVIKIALIPSGIKTNYRWEVIEFPKSMQNGLNAFAIFD